MNYIYGFIIVVFVCIVLLKHKKHDNKMIKMEYTILMTDTFVKSDAQILRPIYTIASNENGNRSEAVFCKVLDGDGELDIKNAQDEMISIIKCAIKDKSFIEGLIHIENISEEEKIAADNIEKEINIMVK
ncbi:MULTISPECIES: hypothetical protein [Clostridium]|uniref:Uncharacterized protein n=1 Tax=Clostridium frigoriphilum TaxID=443253 RepID=A0ABU7UM90_9CLOT|nr:hypothetical protein [Clostridium sp. DSM 17811]MBU3100001.1 hypothetical protein [Clostridium sp. DSM 17811]